MDNLASIISHLRNEAAAMEVSAPDHETAQRCALERVAGLRVAADWIEQHQEGEKREGRGS